MGSIPILLCGMTVVMGGILWLRMHAFLALILGALTVAALTPKETLFESELVPNGIPVISQRIVGFDTNPNANLIQIEIPKDRENKIPPGEYTFYRRMAEDGSWTQKGSLQLMSEGTHLEEGKAIPNVYVFQNIDLFGLAKPVEVGDLLVSKATVKAATHAANKPLGDRIAAGFGKTCLDIGILIAMAAIVGECLLKSGAAQRVVVSTRRAFGEKHTPWAFLVSGFVVAIPVFFDTVFLLLMPLAKALRMQTGKNYLLYILSIVAGGTMAHSLVPPTPGPLLVASELGVSVGAMIIGGTIVGSIAALGGFAYALWANRRWDIPLRNTAHSSNAEIEAMAAIDENTLPPLWLSLSPILLPVFFIAGLTVLDYFYGTVPTDAQPAWVKALWPVLAVLGHKNIALIVAAAVALLHSPGTIGLRGKRSQRPYKRRWPAEP